jgi:hypothetical protein
VSRIQGLPVSSVSAVVEAVENELGDFAKVKHEMFEIFRMDHLFGSKKPLKVWFPVSSTEIADFSWGNALEKSIESLHD